MQCGAAHRDAHATWWSSRIRKLEEIWLALERLTCQRVRKVRAASATTSEALRALERLHSALSRRQRLRSAWAQRARDPIFTELDEGYQPLACLHDAQGPLAGTLPGELSGTVDELADVLRKTVLKRGKTG